LIADLEKMINIKKFSYKINLKDIPISNKLKNVLDLKKLSKINYISMGDDYQVLFTASKDKRRIISKISSNYGVKITRIGSIKASSKKPTIFDHKNKQISLKNKGYFHIF
jgi:thiamine-monophosphate kinase